MWSKNAQTEDAPKYLIVEFQFQKFRNRQKIAKAPKLPDRIFHSFRAKSSDKLLEDQKS